MPLTQSDIAKILERFPRLNEPSVYEKVRKVFVDDVESPEDSYINEDVLTQARAAAITANRKLHEEHWFGDPNIPDAVKAQFKIDELGRRVPTNANMTPKQAMARGMDIDFVENFKPEVFGSRILGDIAAGVMTGGQTVRNIPVLGKLITDAPVHMFTDVTTAEKDLIAAAAASRVEEEGLFSPAGFFATATELSAFLSLAKLAGAGGAAIVSREAGRAALSGGLKGIPGLLSETFGFGAAGALTSPGGLGERILGGIMSAAAVPSAAVLVRGVATPLAGRLQSKILGSIGRTTDPAAAEFSKFMAQRLIPASLDTMAANTAFTLSGMFNSMALGEEFRFWESWLHGMAVLSFFKGIHFGKAERQAAKRKKAGYIVTRPEAFARERLRMRAAGTIANAKLAGVDVPHTIRLLRERGLSVVDVQLARIYAEQGRVPSLEEAHRLATDFEATQKTLALDANFLLMTEKDFDSWLSAHFDKIRISQDPVGTDMELVDPVNILRERPGSVSFGDVELMGMGPNQLTRVKDLLRRRTVLRRGLVRAARAAKHNLDQSMKLIDPGWDPKALAKSLGVLEETRSALERNGLDTRDIDRRIQNARMDLVRAHEVVAVKKRNPAVSEYSYLAGRMNEKLKSINEELSLVLNDVLFPDGAPLFRLTFTVMHPGSPSNLAAFIESIKLTRKGKRVLRTFKQSTGLDVSKGELKDADYQLLADYLDRFKKTQYPRSTKKLEELRARLGKPGENEQELQKQILTLEARAKGRTAAEQERDDIKQTWKWIHEVSKWMGDPEKDSKPMPKWYGRKDVDPVALLARMEGIYPPFEIVKDVAANVVPPNSKAAQLLAGTPEEAAAAARELEKTNTLIPPTIELAQPFKPLSGVEIPGKVPDIETTVREVEQISKTILQSVDADMPGYRSAAAGAGGVLLFTKPSMADHTYRQQFLSMRKMILGPAGIELANLSLAAQASFVRLTRSATDFVEAHGKSYADYLHSLDGKQRAAAVKRFADLREGFLDKNAETLHPAEAHFLNAFDRLMKAYQTALELRDFPVIKDGTYFTRIAKDLVHKEGLGRYLDETSREHFLEISSRFLKHRTGADFDYVRDVFEVLRTYIPAVNKVVAFRPMANAIERLVSHIGIEPTVEGITRASKEIDLGHKKIDATFKKGGMPMQTAKWLAGWTKVMQGVPGPASRLLEGMFDMIGTGLTVGKYPRIGRQLIGGIISLNNALGVGGFFQAAKWVRNVVTGGAISFADPNVGPGDYIRGSFKLFQRDKQTGTYRVNPLLIEMGIMGQRFVEFVEGQTYLGLNRRLENMSRHALDMWMAMFGFSETIVRGSTALGAYQRAKGRGMSHEQALKVGRDAAARTQTNYDSVTGGRAFAGSAGKGALQFQRFGFNWFDQVWAHVQNSGMLGSKQQRIGRAKLPTAEEIAGLKRPAPKFSLRIGETDLQLQGMATFLASIYLGNLAFRAIGVAIDELRGPMASAPEVVKEPIAALVERTTGILRGDDVGKTLLQGGQTPETMEAAKQVNDLIGVSTRSPGILSALLDSTGPLVPLIATPLDIITGRGPKADAELKRELQDWRLITSGGTQVDRVMTFIQETHKGYVESRITGQRMFPAGRKMTAGERVLRLLGFRPLSLDEELQELDRAHTHEALWDAKVRDLNKEAKDMLIEGESPSEVMGSWLGGMAILQDEFSLYLPMNNLKQRWAAIVNGAGELSSKTFRQRIEEETPFVSPAR